MLKTSTPPCPCASLLHAAKVVAVKEQETKAKAVAELSSSSGGLFEHLMAVANNKQGRAGAAGAGSAGAAAAAAPASDNCHASASSASSSSSAPASSPAAPAPPGSPSWSSLSAAAEASASKWPASLGLGPMYNLDKQVHGERTSVGNKCVGVRCRMTRGVVEECGKGCAQGQALEGPGGRNDNIRVALVEGLALQTEAAVCCPAFGCLGDACS